MKKIFGLLFLLVLQAAVFAQWLNPSLENALTGGAFDNEIDKAFNASPDFGTYEQQFIFGGLGNPNATEMDGNDKLKLLSGSIDWKAFGNMLFSRKAPAAFGYYFPGKIPFSIYTSLWAKGLSAAQQAVPTQTLKTWNNQDHSKLKSEATTSSTWMPIFKEYDFKTQFLIGLGEGMSTGLYFSLYGNNSAFDNTAFQKVVFKDKEDSKNNSTSTMVNVDNAKLAAFGATAFNTNALATAVSTGALPFLAVDKGAFTHEFKIGVPFAFETGDMTHTATFEIGGEVTNSNASLRGKDKDEEVKYNYTKYDSLIDLGLGYTLEMPAKDREDDAYIMNAGLEFNFGSTETHAKLKTKKDKIDLTYSEKQKPGLGFKLSADFGRKFNFESPAKAVAFSMTPTAGIELYSGHDEHDNLTGAGYDNEKTVVLKSSNDKASYSSKTTKSAKQYMNVTEFNMAASCPMGLKILPENWKIGFLLGATPELTYTVTATFDRSHNYKTDKNVKKTELNGTKTETTVDAKYQGTTYTSGAKTLEQKVEVSESHFIGITVPFEGGTHLDIALNGKNLLEFEGFVIQAFIPLGKPKSRN